MYICIKDCQITIVGVRKTFEVGDQLTPDEYFDIVKVAIGTIELDKMDPKSGYFRKLGEFRDERIDEIFKD